MPHPRTRPRNFFLTSAAPHKRPGLRSTLHIAPSHQLGNAYERKLKVRFITLEPRLPFHSYIKCPWDEVYCYVYSSFCRSTNGFTAREKHHEPPTVSFRAVAEGILNWVDRLLWAGAEPRHEEDELSVLDFAWQAGRRDQVVRLLDAHAWHGRELEVFVYAQISLSRDRMRYRPYPLSHGEYYLCASISRTTNSPSFSETSLSCLEEG
jgi:hypothetical protein